MFNKFLIIFFITVNATANNISPITPETKAKLYDKKIQAKECACLDNRLQEMQVKYYDFAGNINDDGFIIVLDVAAKHVENIFKQLVDIKFPIFGIDPFKGVKNDTFLFFFKTKTIDDNYNYTGAFSCSKLTGSRDITSIRGYGLSILLNPLLNPYIGISLEKNEITTIIPKNGIFNINRTSKRPGKPERKGIINKQVVEIFKRNGFNIWGGNWDYPINYMQFSVSRPMATMLTAMSYQDAEIFFDLNVKYINDNYDKYNNDDLMTVIMEQTQQNEIDLKMYYKQYPQKFMNMIKMIIKNK